MSTEQQKSTGGLLSDALAHVSALVRNEVDLARTEINENLNRAAVAVGMIIGAIVLALTALNVLSAALVAALTELGIDAGWSALIVGVALAAVALGMAVKGKNDLSARSLAPTRTTENVKRDTKAVKEVYNDRR